MAADTAARTREDQVRRYVQLDALSDVLSELAEYIGSRELVDSLLGSMPWDTLSVDDGTTYGDLYAVREQLWPEDDDRDREGTVAFNIAVAESYAMQARMLVLLTTDEARTYMANRASQAADGAARYMGRVRALLELDDAPREVDA